MSIYNAIAQGSNIGAGINAFAQNQYMVNQDRELKAERQEQNAFARQQRQAETMRQIFMDAVQLGPDAGYDYTARMAQQYGFPQPSEEYRWILAKAAAQMGRGKTVPAEVASFRMLTEGMSPQEVERARRIQLGLDPRASAPGNDFAWRFGQFQGADGRARMTRSDPNRGVTEILADDGQSWIPVGSAMAQSPAQATPQPAGATAATPQSLPATPGAPVQFSGRPKEEEEKAVAEAKATVISPEIKQKAQEKINTARRINLALDAVEAAFSELQGSMSAGPFGQGYAPTEAGARFDKAVAALAPLVRQLTRVPGEGSMSDYEQRLAQMALPDRTTYENVTADQIRYWRMLAGDVESGYADLLGANPAKSDDEWETLEGGIRVRAKK